MIRISNEVGVAQLCRFGVLQVMQTCCANLFAQRATLESCSLPGHSHSASGALCELFQRVPLCLVSYVANWVALPMVSGWEIN